jgi:hypothetical protein
MFENKGKKDLRTEVVSLRTQGLTDDMIVQELSSKGFSEPQIISQLSQVNSAPMGDMSPMPSGMPQAPPGMSQGPSGMPMPPSDQTFASAPSQAPQSNSFGQGTSDSIYSRIEEITEGLIDEKWDELIGEVKKIVAWKEKVEEKTKKLESDISKLTDDFKTLHTAVLGKVEQYDNRIRDVGVELKAVGKVFKDVVPIFTENVKELKHITSGIKQK